MSMIETSARDLEVGYSIEVDGIQTHYHDAGSGPVVLFIHGSGPGVSAWANWRGALPALADRFRVIAYDQLGYNETLPPEGTSYGREAWTTHALAFLDALGIDKVHLVGNSMGGAIALSLAAARPEMVDHIVLMGTVGIDMEISPALDELWGTRPSRPAMRRAIELLANDQSLNTDELVELRYQASVKPGVDEAWRDMFPAPRQRWVDDLALSREELQAISHPVLLIHGYEDQVIPFEATTLRLMDILPDVQMHVFGNCGHWVQIEQAAGFVQALSAFLPAPGHPSA